MSVYGKFVEDGAAKEPTESILTGKSIEVNGSIRERIKGSDFFYRFEGRYAHMVTDKLRKQWAKDAPKDSKIRSVKNDG